MLLLQRVFIILFCVLGLTSCKSETHVETSFYYWKTNFDLTGSESQALTQLGTKRLYVRFFDVDYEDYSDVIAPIGRLTNGQSFPKDMEIVPVIFIKNKILGERYSEGDHDENAPAPADIDEQNLIDSTGIRSLAEKIVRKTLRMAKRYSSQELREIQLDCDWTPSTRDRFFYLVSEVKRLVQPTKVSATIRLHQFKYPDKMGVPPADRGMLMYYNMSRLSDTNTKNYILDNTEGEKYLLDAKKYPLPLDFALPIHTQGSVYSNNSGYNEPQMMRYSGLVSGPVFEQLRAEGNFAPIDKHTYKVLQEYSNFQNQTWLQKDFLVRYDEVSTDDLLDAADLVAPLANTDSYYVTFFHLDSMNIAHHPHETLARIVDRFR